jgi:hypothetical protein
MGALVGIFPTQFLLQSQIAESTNTHTYLKTVFGLDNPKVDSQVLLNAVAFMTDTNQRIAEGACCKAAQEWSSQTTGKQTKAVDTIYKGMSILTVKKSGSSTGGTSLKSLTIYELNQFGISPVTRDDLTWKSPHHEEGIKIMPWANHYYCADNNSMSTTTEQQPSSTGNNFPMKRKLVVAQELTKTSAQPHHQTDSSKKKKCRITASSHQTLTKETMLPEFNYPSQRDVILNGRRHAFNKWRLLAYALMGTKDNDCQSASKHAIQLNKVKHPHPIGERFVPSIKCLADATVFYPPIPESFWKTTSKRFEFSITEDGHVSFECADLARKYTAIKFLIEKHSDVLNAFFTGLLENTKFKFNRDRRKSRREQQFEDPLKMVVLYDSDDHSKVPIAVSLLLTECRGAFALVDQYGSIIKKSTYSFTLINKND